MPYFGVRMPYFCGNPLILTDFYAIQTPIVWHIFGAYFLQIWGVGVVRIIFRLPPQLELRYPPYGWLPLLWLVLPRIGGYDAIPRNTQNISIVRLDV